MPIYEYRCDSCGFQKEHLQKVSEPLLTHCPQCSGDRYNKLLSAAGFKLKGNGWYATDFKNKPVKDSAPKKTDESPPCHGVEGACPCAAPTDKSDTAASA